MGRLLCTAASSIRGEKLRRELCTVSSSSRRLYLSLPFECYTMSGHWHILHFPSPATANFPIPKDTIDSSCQDMGLFTSSIASDSNFPYTHRYNPYFRNKRSKISTFHYPYASYAKKLQKRSKFNCVETSHLCPPFPYPPPNLFLTRLVTRSPNLNSPSSVPLTRSCRFAIQSP